MDVEGEVVVWELRVWEALDVTRNEIGELD